MPTSYNAIAGQSVERLASLSDGLFAFALTLLVYDIHVPTIGGIHSEQQLQYALATLLPRLLTYALSFLTLGIFWVGHHTLLRYCERSDRNLTWMNLLFLALVALVPFSARLLGDFITFRTALLLYWLNVLALGAVVYWSWSYVNRAGLVRADTSAAVVQGFRQRILLAQALYAVGALLCLISTYWSMGFILLVQLNYALAPRSQAWFKPHTLSSRIPPR
jgi:uncharacterized membrane protein